MAIAIHVAGPAKIYVASMAFPLSYLGMTANGAEIKLEPAWQEIYTDDGGADVGIPVDAIYLGDRGTIKTEFVAFDATLANTIITRWPGSNPGVYPGSAMMMRGTESAMRLLIASPSEPVNFPVAYPRQAIEFTKGTRYTRLLIVWEALPKWDAAKKQWVLYDSNTNP